MARQTRAQRRARREAQAVSAGAALPAAAAPPIAPPPRPLVARGAEAEPRRARRGLPGQRFIGECWGELKKVEWPGQKQVIQGTVVVLIACIIVGFYLYVADQVFKRVVNDIFLR